MSQTAYRSVPKKPKKGKVMKLQDQKTLKGTLLSVFLLGSFFIISWLAVYTLFQSR